MLIDHIQLINFKSFYGKHIIGPFHPHFSCIIGPNGNGKSNIIDAVLFAFGFKSAKLRQGDLASLIHHSEQYHPSFCQVSVIFSFPNKIYKSISRIVHKNGHSHYLKDNKKISWTLLRQDLIKDDIDLEKNLFIILQGQVQKLCQMSTQKLVQHLEYICGSDRYKLPIEKLEQNYIDNCIKKEQIKKIYLIKNNQYEKYYQKIIKILSWMHSKCKIIQVSHLIIKKNIIELKDKQKKLKQELQIKINSYKQQQQQLQDKRKQIKKIQIEKQKQKKNKKKIQQQLNIIQQQIQNLIRQNKNKKILINYINKDKIKKNNEIKRYKKQLENLSELIQNNQQIRINYCRIEKQIKNISNNSKQNQLNKYQMCWEIQCNLIELTKQLTIINTKLDQEESIKLEKNKININHNSLIQEKIKFKVQLKQTIEQLYEINKKKEQCRKSIELLNRKERQSSRIEQKQIIASSLKLKKQIKKANELQIICSGYTLKTLSQGIILNQEWQNIIYMIVPQLEYFLVQNSLQAQQLIKYLNINQLGRLTVIIQQDILNVMKNVQINNWQAIQHSKRIIDVCGSINQKFLKIMFWAVGNTLLVEQLSMAIKIAYNGKRNRVITKKGQFIDISGTITVLNNKKYNYNDIDTIKKKQQILNRKQEQISIKNNNLEKKKQILMIKIEEIIMKQNYIKEQLKEQKQKLQNINKELNKDKQKLKIITTKIQLLQTNLKNIRLKIHHTNEQYNINIEIIKQFHNERLRIRKIDTSYQIKIHLMQQIKKLQSEQKELQNKKEQQIYDLQNGAITQQIKLKQSIMKNKQQQIIQLKQQLELLQQKQFLLNLEIEQKQNKQLKQKNKIKKFKQEIKLLQNNIKLEINKLKISFQEIQNIFHIINNNNNNINKQIYQIMNFKDIQFNCQIIIYIGKKQINFYHLLHTLQIELCQNLLNISNINKIIQNINQNIIFTSIQVKQLKSILIIQLEKLQYLNKEIHCKHFTQIQQEFITFIEINSNYILIKQKLQQIDQIVAEQRKQLLNLRSKRLDCFNYNFNHINIHLSSIYKEMTGGSAQLSLLDVINPFQGVQFTVRPVNKSWKSINLLSGGQRTLTSLAFIFACKELKKYPFYIMDQIDAALDYHNTTILAQYIKKHANTQYIVVSLRNNMFQQANILIGVYKILDQTNTILLDRQKYQEQ